VTVRGKGLMLGADATVTIQPAPPHSGVAFVRTDLNPPVRIPATADHVAPRPRRTTLKSGDVTIDTVEHCLSAIAGLRIDNATIEINGPELPCGDGSAALFAEPILEAGIVEQEAPRKVFKIREPIVIEEPEGMIAAMPFDAPGMRVVYDLDYGKQGHRIRHQTFSYNVAGGNYIEEIAPARTYSLREEAEALQAAGAGGPHGTHMHWVFAVGLLGPAPAGMAQQVDADRRHPVGPKRTGLQGDRLPDALLQLRIPAGAPGDRHRKGGGTTLEHHTPRPIDKLQSRQPQAGQLVRRPGVAVGGIRQGDVGHPRPKGRVAIKQGQLLCIVELGQQHQGPGPDGGRDLSHLFNVRSIQPGTQGVAIVLNKAFALATELPQRGKARA
jgi:hypothetical protein